MRYFWMDDVIAIASWGLRKVTDKNLHKVWRRKVTSVWRKML